MMQFLYTNSLEGMLVPCTLTELIRGRYLKWHSDREENCSRREPIIRLPHHYSRYQKTLPSFLFHIQKCNVLLHDAAVADQFSLDGMRNLAHHILAREVDHENVIDIFRDATEQLPQLGKLY